MQPIGDGNTLMSLLFSLFDPFKNTGGEVQFLSNEEVSVGYQTGLENTLF